MSIDIVYPKDRYVTYAHQWDVSDEVLARDDETRVLDHLKQQTVARAIQDARWIDRRAPIVTTIETCDEQPRTSPYARRWRISVRVEFQAYVYDQLAGISDGC